MLKRVDRVAEQALGSLHRSSIEDPRAVRSLLERVAGQRVWLTSGVGPSNERRLAQIDALDSSSMALRVENFAGTTNGQVFFEFQLGGYSYFFSSNVLGLAANALLQIGMPSAIYRTERRDSERQLVHGQSESVELRDGAWRATGLIVDRSNRGLAVEIETNSVPMPVQSLQVRFQDRGTSAYAQIRHRSLAKKTGWVRLGLEISQVEPGPIIPIQTRDRIVQRPLVGGILNDLQMLRSASSSWSQRALSRLRKPQSVTEEIEILEYANEKGEPIKAIVDAWGNPRGATAVIIPPAWGRTKETLLPLALTIKETFKRAGEPVVVVRFDGTNRRGESHIDPECCAPGDEYLHFTFSQAARDITATVRHLYESPRLCPRTAVLVTFSLAAVEGRRALSSDLEGRFGGWVCAVGMADLQSALRAISGGIDYGYGLLKGVRFGRHELVGVVADMDRTGLDAIEHKIGFLEEVRRDMAAIRIPITWIHGRHDAWMDIGRVQGVMSAGQISNRKLIEVPTGHQLRSSRKALETFQLIAEEVGEMALGRRIPSAVPAFTVLENRRRAERARLPETPVDLRAFWKDYILGRDRRIGMELLTATAAYRNFLQTQIRLLGIRQGSRIADFGSGTGELSQALRSSPSGPTDLIVDEIDLLHAALKRSRERMRGPAISPVVVNRAVADLDLCRGRSLCVGNEVYDSVLASLLVNYLSSPERVLRAIYNATKPGGRVVVSGLRSDADISKLFMDGMKEFATPAARATLGNDAAEHFDDLVRSFLNDAARILDLEEKGTFRFWEPEEFLHLVSNAGFTNVRMDLSLGEPPQAIVVAATRP